MSVILKKDTWKIKDPNTGEYRDSTVFASTLSEDMAAAIDAQETRAAGIISDTSAGLTAQETRAAGIVSDAQADIDTIAASVQSMTQTGTDTTLTVSGAAADAAVVGELKAAVFTERLGENIAQGFATKHGTNTSYSIDYNDGSITVTGGTSTWAGVSNTNANITNTNNKNQSLKHYLKPNKKYRMHIKVEVLNGSPYCNFAIRGRQDDATAIVVSCGSLYDSTDGEFTTDFVADEYMSFCTLFVAGTSSRNGAKVKYSEIWIKEIIDSANDFRAVAIEPKSIGINALNLNADDITAGSYITSASFGSGNTITFNWTNSSKYNESGYIPVEPFDKIYRGLYSEELGGYYRNPSLSLVFYDENKDPLFIVYPGTLDDLCYIAPKNAKYIRIPIDKTAQNPYVYIFHEYEEVVNTSELIYTPYNLKTSLANELKSMWCGKKWYAYGTSITNTSNEGKYPKYLQRLSGTIFTNKGISGGGIGNLGAYSTGQVYNAICNITDGKLDADLITLETGANDVNNSVPLGTIYDTGTATLSGCLNDCLRYLQANTTAQIVVFCSPASTTVPTAESHAYYEWASMIEQICKLNRVHFINSNCNLGFAKLNSENGSNYVVDNIHQTDLGACIYAKNIWNQLKNISPMDEVVDI